MIGMFVAPSLAAAPGRLSSSNRASAVLGRSILRPAIGGGDGAIEVGVRVGEPLRALIVEIGQRALPEFQPPLRRFLAHKRDAVRITERLFARRGGGVSGSGTISTRSGGFSQLRRSSSKPLRRHSDADRARVVRVIRRRCVGRESLRERGMFRR